MNAAAALRAAQTKIRAPENWAKGAQAYDRRGVAVDPFNPDAVCFCAVGALVSVCSTDPDFYRILHLLEQQLPDGFELVTAYNDNATTTHRAIINFYERAIEAAAITAATSRNKGKTVNG